MKLEILRLRWIYHGGRELEPEYVALTETKTLGQLKELFRTNDAELTGSDWEEWQNAFKDVMKTITRRLMPTSDEIRAVISAGTGYMELQLLPYIKTGDIHPDKTIKVLHSTDLAKLTSRR